MRTNKWHSPSYEPLYEFSAGKLFSGKPESLYPVFFCVMLGPIAGGTAASAACLRALRLPAVHPHFQMMMAMATSTRALTPTAIPAIVPVESPELLSLLGTACGEGVVLWVLGAAPLLGERSGADVGVGFAELLGLGCKNLSRSESTLLSLAAPKLEVGQDALGLAQGLVLQQPINGGTLKAQVYHRLSLLAHSWVGRLLYSSGEKLDVLRSLCGQPVRLQGSEAQQPTNSLPVSQM